MLKWALMSTADRVSVLVIGLEAEFLLPHGIVILGHPASSCHPSFESLVVPRI
jgi:hypothetical protein